AIAHFGRTFENDPSIPKIYHKPARAKNEEEKFLRGKIEELKARNIRLIMIAPPSVPSRNLDAVEELTRRATGGKQSAIGIHNGISDRLGLPRTVSQNDVGERIVELLSNPNIKSGYTELFSGVFDAQTALEHWYGIPQVYVSTLKREGEVAGVKRGIGRAIASIEQAVRPNDPKMIDSISHDADGNYVGSVRITPQHAEGHFAEESGFPRILPGHKQIRAAVETIGMINRESGNSVYGMRLIGFESATFSSTIPADGDTELTIKPVENSDGTYDVEISRLSDGKQTAFIKKLRLMPAEDLEEPELLEDQLLEGAAQATGIVALEDLDSQTMPLLLGIGRTEFLGGGVKAGEGIKYDVYTKRVDKREIEGSVLIYSGDKIIGVTNEIRAVLVPKPVATRLLSSHA
ncbi:MAG: hypothetical protein US51_C0032G0001, partial [Microgenomates group bacterium GW2011_GWA2_37_6]